MKKSKRNAKAQRSSPSVSWLSPRGKTLTNEDEISIRFLQEDLLAIRLMIDAAMIHLDEGRGAEERIVFAERLMRIREWLGKVDMVVRRSDLNAFHQAIHVAAGLASSDLDRGVDSPITFMRRLARIRKTILAATHDHDDVPEGEQDHR